MEDDNALARVKDRILALYEQAEKDYLAETTPMALGGLRALKRALDIIRDEERAEYESR